MGCYMGGLMGQLLELNIFSALTIPSIIIGLLTVKNSFWSSEIPFLCLRFVCMLGQNEEYLLVTQTEEFMLSQVYDRFFYPSRRPRSIKIRFCVSFPCDSLKRSAECDSVSYRIMSHGHTDAVVLLYFPILLNSKSNI